MPRSAMEYYNAPGILRLSQHFPGQLLMQPKQGVPQTLTQHKAGVLQLTRRMAGVLQLTQRTPQGLPARETCSASCLCCYPLACSWPHSVAVGAAAATDCLRWVPLQHWPASRAVAPQAQEAKRASLRMVMLLKLAAAETAAVAVAAVPAMLIMAAAIRMLMTGAEWGLLWVAGKAGGWPRCAMTTVMVTGAAR
jgi:hypothetical protein